MHSGLVRHILSPLLERLLGRQTFHRLAELEVSQWWPRESVRSLQARRLAALLRAAARNCPYYARLFEVRGVAWGERHRTEEVLPGKGPLPHRRGLADATVDDDPFEQLAKLPLLDKGAVRRHLADMTNHRVPGGPIPFNTGGSTGDPLGFFVDRERIAADKAARLLTHGWFGAMPGAREIYLWGSPIEIRAQDRLKRLRDWLTNERLLSAFDLSPASMSAYLRRIRAFDPVSVFGYPSSLTTLAEYGEATGQRCSARSLRVVFTTGELLEAGQRATLERYFGVRVADGYGSRDGGFLAHECPAGRLHVIDPDVVIEIIDETGAPLPPGDTGEIVVTHLANRALPLIRYRTGDMGALDDTACPCGRSWRVMGMTVGRRTDHLVSENGALQHGLSAIYVLREMATVRRFQVHQLADRSLSVQVVPEPTYGPADTERIRRGLKRRLGPNVPVVVRLVEAIHPLPSGKSRQIISDAMDMEAASPGRGPRRNGVA